MFIAPAQDVLTLKDFLTSINIIIGGILAILGGFFGNYVIESLKEKRLRKNLALAFQGEISALTEIVNRRGYIDGIKKCLQTIETSGRPLKYIFVARKEYFSVFEANVGQIGIMCPPLPHMVPRFYVQAKSILEDMEQLEAGTVWGQT